MFSTGFMEINHLFKKFLEDKQVYQNNVVYWKNILGNIINRVSARKKGTKSAKKRKLE